MARKKNITVDDLWKIERLSGPSLSPDGAQVVASLTRYSMEDKIDYFVHFLHDGPMGKIDQRFIQVGCNTALDAGLYTFTFFKTGAVVHARYSYTYGYINSYKYSSSNTNRDSYKYTVRDSYKHTN
jgi:hypothetical protein